MFGRITAALRAQWTERTQQPVPVAQAGEQADRQQGLPPVAVADAANGSIPLIGAPDTPQVAKIRADIEASKHLPAREALALLDMTLKFAWKNLTGAQRQDIVGELFLACSHRAAHAQGEEPAQMLQFIERHFISHELHSDHVILALTDDFMAAAQNGIRASDLRPLHMALMISAESSDARFRDFATFLVGALITVDAPAIDHLRAHEPRAMRLLIDHAGAVRHDTALVDRFVWFCGDLLKSCENVDELTRILRAQRVDSSLGFESKAVGRFREIALAKLTGLVQTPQGRVARPEQSEAACRIINWFLDSGNGAPELGQVLPLALNFWRSVEVPSGEAMRLFKKLLPSLSPREQAEMAEKVLTQFRAEFHSPSPALPFDDIGNPTALMPYCRADVCLVAACDIQWAIQGPNLQRKVGLRIAVSCSEIPEEVPAFHAMHWYKTALECAPEARPAILDEALRHFQGDPTAANWLAAISFIVDNYGDTKRPGSGGKAFEYPESVAALRAELTSKWPEKQRSLAYADYKRELPNLLPEHRIEYPYDPNNYYHELKLSDLHVLLALLKR